jgi:hypothetical protein
MTEDRFETTFFCGVCANWIELFAGGYSVMAQIEGKTIGVCNCVKSDHNQHIVGYMHPACAELIERWEVLKERLDGSDG